jgi:hypothetical protein
VAVRHLVAQLAVAPARDLALVRHQTDGDESFADALSQRQLPRPVGDTARRGEIAANIAKLPELVGK